MDQVPRFDSFNRLYKSKLQRRFSNERSEVDAFLQRCGLTSVVAKGRTVRKCFKRLWFNSAFVLSKNNHGSLVIIVSSKWFSQGTHSHRKRLFLCNTIQRPGFYIIWSASVSSTFASLGGRALSDDGDEHKALTVVSQRSMIWWGSWYWVVFFEEREEFSKTLPVNTSIWAKAYVSLLYCHDVVRRIKSISGALKEQCWFAIFILKISCIQPSFTFKVTINVSFYLIN